MSLIQFGSTLDRLTPIEELQAEGKWFYSDEEQDHARDVVFLGQSTLYAISMRHELSEDQQTYFDHFAPDGDVEALATEVKQQEFVYYETLRCMAQHKLAQYHEYMNRNEIPAKHHKYICEKLEKLEAREVRLILLSMPPGSAKAQAINTYLPTPYGPTTISDIEVGDFVWSVHGTPTQVIDKSEVFTGRECFRVYNVNNTGSFNGEGVVCDGEHLWTVRLDRKRNVWRTFTTKELYERQLSGKGRRPRFPDYAPLEYAEEYVPVIKPYTLGAWLGDGTHNSGGMTCHPDDVFIINRIMTEGYEVHKNKHPCAFYIQKFVSLTKEIGVYKNKHIPKEYFHMSVSNRIALLQGLCDTDGTVTKKGHVSISTSNPRLRDDILRLIRELGITASYTTQRTSRKDNYRIRFRFQDAFSLPRKKERISADRDVGTYMHIEPVASVPTQCITVAEPDGLFLIGKDYIVTHNSSYASRSFIQWYMGRHPDHKILSGGYNLRFVENEFSKPNRSYIDSPEYKHIFPDVEIDPDFRSASLWALLKFGGRYNVRSVGAGTSGIRANLIVLDDIIAGAKTATSMVELDDANRWVVSDVLPRRLPDAVILIIGTRWNSNDPLGYLQKMLEVSPESMPSPFEVINISAEGGPDNPIVEEGHWLWEEFYGAKHYITQRTTMEAWLWSATYLGIPIDQQGMFFKEEDLDRFVELPEGEHTTTLSIDTAQKSGTANNRTAMVVFKEYKDGVSYVDDAWAGREPLLSLVDRIGKLCKKHKVNRILIEDAAMGSQIIENYANAFPAPIIPIKPQGKGTKEFNFDTFLVPKIQTGVICFPKQREWLADLINEIVSFPDGRYDDYVDACAQYARHTTRRGKYGAKQIRLGL